MSDARHSEPPLSVPCEWIDHLPERPLNPADLYSAIRDAEVLRDEGSIWGSERAEKDLEIATTDAVRAAALKNVRIRLRDKEYTIGYQQEIRHEPGQGGTVMRATSLARDGKCVLVSIVNVEYDTYMDDSEDHETRRSTGVYLLEHDPLAAVIIDAIR